MGNQLNKEKSLNRMRFEILAATFAATVYGQDNATLCGTWKYGVYATKTGEGWTLTTPNNVPIYKDSTGSEITDWTSYTGYSTSGCADVADTIDDALDDSAVYLASGMTLLAAATSLAF